MSLIRSVELLKSILIKLNVAFYLKLPRKNFIFHQFINRISTLDLIWFLNRKSSMPRQAKPGNYLKTIFYFISTHFCLRC
jgi:hypothetical protein